jgi:hypothetical protein
MNGGGFVDEMGELAGISLIKSPLDPGCDQDNKDGGVAVYFLHSLLVCGFLKLGKLNNKIPAV